MLAPDELNVLSQFARYVDCYPLIRRRVAAAHSLESIVAIAHKSGHHDLSCELLVKAAMAFRSSEWVWLESGKRWSDHLFVLALVIQAEGMIAGCRHIDCQSPVEINYNEQQADAFYAQVKESELVQQELSRAATIHEVLKISRRLGFRLRRIDIVIREHQWIDQFFPWNTLSAREKIEFFYAEDLMVVPPGNFQQVAVVSEMMDPLLPDQVKASAEIMTAN